ncbi:xanthine dehydrogenase family protein molybdopterin-binding subunit [Candidatus Hecatella orcuttiae]|uniref:xanthine dehydrogenase family protein molybdopterin-binding subunit n=1 Tax=Candidatus Hecatella orcuttiae TaxID=1935119 RepID=UPI0028682D40|nr:xanthine dehydrogenase family protein molybdopterin-binding subunit [Candidatus Hecatella orcuttiae]
MIEWKVYPAKGAQEFKWIGKSIPRKESYEKVTGAAKFVADMKADLCAKILRSPHPHAIIKNIDTSEAEKLPGVAAIITHKDVPKRLLPRSSARACYILEDHVRYVGDEVAAVAAVSEEVADEALDLIKVEYEVLPAVFDPEEAAREDAPKLYPEGNVYGPLGGTIVEKGIREPTVLEWGDLDKGFKEADVIVEDKFVVKPQIHAPLEPHVCLAQWEGDRLTLWVATQTKHEIIDSLSYVFEMPSSKIRVISRYVGGGFGSKYIERYIPIAALLSKKAKGKSVKLVYTREEEQCHTKRAGQKIYVKIGAKKDGTFTAIHFKTYCDIGGYGNSVSGSCQFWEEAPAISYKAENARFEAWDVHVNYFSTQPFRSVQVPSTNFALEQVIDQVAEKLGKDPAEIRLKNMPETGDVVPPKPYKNPFYPRAALDTYPSKKMLQEVLKEIGWKEKWKGWGKPVAVEGSKRRGIGLAYSAAWGGFNYDGLMTMTVTMYPDGSLTILSGTQDLGTGSNTTLCMIAAEHLGISLEEVSIIADDTAVGQFDYYEARSSRTLTIGGHMLLLAIEDAKRKICETVAPKLEVPPENLEVKEKKVYVKNDPKRMIPLTEAITSTVVGTASGPPGSEFPEIEPGFKWRNPLVSAAEVEVDVETGEVKIVKLVPSYCPGRMVNPKIVIGQYLGGALCQGVGMALYENFNFDEKNNVYVSRNFLDYKIPRATEMYEVKPVIIEEVKDRPPHVGPPYGVRGVGEWGIGVIVPVIANAIYNALGVRVKRCPMTSEVVLEALRGGKE